MKALNKVVGGPISLDTWFSFFFTQKVKQNIIEINRVSLKGRIKELVKTVKVLIRRLGSTDEFRQT